MAIEKNIPNELVQEGLPFSCLINTTINLFEDGLALGIYCLLASKPCGWVINNQYIMNKFKIGRDLCKKKLTYIKSLGLISHEQIRDKKGRIIRVKTTLHRTPTHSTENQYRGSSTVPDIQSTENPGSGGSAPINKGLKSSISYIKTKGTSDEVQISSKKFVLKKEAQNTSYNKFDEGNEKSDYESNQCLSRADELQSLEENRNSTKSDYFDNQSNKNTDCKLHITYGLKEIQKENIFLIPEQIIQDWITNRKKKRAPITVTAWNKINKELTKCKEQGIDPIESFETMVASGWMSLKVEYFITQELLSKQEASKKRSIELEQIAERRKQKEIQDSKRLNGIVSKASENARRQLRQMVGSRSPNITSS